MSDAPSIVMLDPVEDLKAMILSNWIHSHTGKQRSLGIPVDPDKYRQKVISMLRRSVVRVATLEGYPSVAFGWACGEPPGIVHYVYVKYPHRRRGLARALLQDLSEYIGPLEVATAKSKPGRGLMQEMGLRYDPKPNVKETA